MELNRPALERIQVIHNYLTRKKYPNCPKLAEALEVTTRTVHRYLDYMRDRLHLPISFDYQRSGYFYTKEVDRLPVPPQAVTEAELFSILVAAKALEQYRGTPWHSPLRRAFKKMAGHLDASERIHLHDLEADLDIRLTGPDELNESNFEMLTRAIHLRRPVGFGYRKHMGRNWESRRINPYQLACVANRWYLIGHDIMRDDIRVFVVGRIREPELLPGTFARPRDFSSEEYLRRSFGVSRGKEDFEVVIDLDPWAGDVFRGRRWHASQQVVELPDGSLRVSFRLDNLEEVEPWVLSWGAHATVIRPQRLIDRVTTAATALLQRYDPPSTLARPAGEELIPKAG